MHTALQKIATFSLLGLFIVPTLVLAHQPRITESRLTQVPDPEVSKAYYGILTGEPDVYVVTSSESFDLYVSVLVPDSQDPIKDVTAQVSRGDEVLATIGGVNAAWKQFYEPFGADTYWDGGEYKVRAEAGTYRVSVTSLNNNSKYSLAIGEIEAFGGTEGLNALTTIPALKRDFFNVSPITFIQSPLSWGLIAVMYVLAFLFGFVYRFVIRRLATTHNRVASKNINKSDRLLRLAIGVGLLLWAITTTWSPVLIFFSGFALFEAIFSWCGLSAALGKNSCQISVDAEIANAQEV